MAACATQAGPWQQLILPKSVPDVTRCGMAPAVEFLEEVSPQTVPKWHCGELPTGCLRKVLPQGPSTQGKVKRKWCRGGKTSIVWEVWRPHTDKTSFQAQDFSVLPQLFLNCPGPEQQQSLRNYPEGSDSHKMAARGKGCPIPDLLRCQHGTI